MFINCCVFPKNFLNFLNSASSAEALVFYLPGVCTHSDDEGKQRKAKVQNILKSLIKTQYLMNTLYLLSKFVVRYLLSMSVYPSHLRGMNRLCLSFTHVKIDDVNLHSCNVPWVMLVFFRKNPLKCPHVNTKFNLKVYWGHGPRKWEGFEFRDQAS